MILRIVYLRLLEILNCKLEVGALIVGDTPGWRLDPLLFSGVKGSGLEHEGLRSAIVEMNEPRMW
jgi:hypothetical protein